MAQKQRTAEGYQPYVPRVPEGIFLRGTIQGAFEGEGQAEGDPGLQEGAVKATMQVRPVHVSYSNGEEKPIWGGRWELATVWDERLGTPMKYGGRTHVSKLYNIDGN